AGSSPDLIARVLSEKLAPALGAPVIVENRPGAGGNLGTALVAKAAPDGYTIGISIPGPLAVNTVLYRKMEYDPFKDLAAVSLVGASPNLLVVDPALAEARYPQVVSTAWNGIVAPARTPRPIVERLSRELVAALRSEDVREKMLRMYFQPTGTAPAGLANLMRSEAERWGKVIRKTGATAD